MSDLLADERTSSRAYLAYMHGEQAWRPHVRTNLMPEASTYDMSTERLAHPIFDIGTFFPSTNNYTINTIGIWLSSLRFPNPNPIG